MSPLRVPRKLFWTRHAREKMHYYRLSEGRVRRVMNMPKRLEVGVAPKTVAMMQPTLLHTMMRASRAKRTKAPLNFRWASRPIAQNHGASTSKESWTEEIWVMVQDVPTGRKIISTWRYPGMTKVRGEITEVMRNEYRSYLARQ